MKLILQGKGKGSTDCHLVEEQSGNKCTVAFSLRNPFSPSQNILLQEVTLETEKAEERLIKETENLEGDLRKETETLEGHLIKDSNTNEGEVTDITIKAEEVYL